MTSIQRMRDFPFPSFTSMSYELQKDTLRLPSYRESVFLRFHPYPRAPTRRKPVEPLMQTVDFRSVEEPVANAGEGSHVLPPEEQGSREERDIALNLDVAMNGVGEPRVKKRHSLTSLIVDLAHAVAAEKASVWRAA